MASTGTEAIEESMTQVDEILVFWFGKKDEKDYGKNRAIWFTKNPKPEFNREENLLPICTVCHLALHAGRRSNVSPGQLSLW